jgi:hypothetical protein
MQQFNTIVTNVPAEEAIGPFGRSGKLAEREHNLTAYAQSGFELNHTHVMTLNDHAVFIDTMTRQVPEGTRSY